MADDPFGEIPDPFELVLLVPRKTKKKRTTSQTRRRAARGAIANFCEQHEHTSVGTSAAHAAMKPRRMTPTMRIELRLLGVRKSLPSSCTVHSVALLESMTVAAVISDVRSRSYSYSHVPGTHVAATPRTLRTTASVLLEEVSPAAPVTQLTCETLVE